MGRKKGSTSKKLDNDVSKDEVEKSPLDILNQLRVDEPVVKPERVTVPLGKYLKILDTADDSKFIEAGKRVANGEIEFSYFTTDNNKGVYYYEIKL